MEDIITLITTANTPNDVNPSVTHNLILELIAMALVAIVMYSVVQMLKNRMEYRLKNKIIDKGISEELASSLLRADPNESKNIRIKRLAILAGCAALIITYYIPPIGLHSPAIFTLIVYFSFLGGYNIFLRKTR